MVRARFPNRNRSSTWLWISGVAVTVQSAALLAGPPPSAFAPALSAQASAPTPPSPSGGSGVTGHVNPADQRNAAPPATAASGSGSDEQPAARGPGGEVDLSPRFRTGEQTRYQLAVQSDQETTSDQTPELNNKQTMEQDFTLVLRVVETTGGVTTIELATERVRMKMDGDAGKAAADSGAPTRATPDGTNPHALPPGAGSPPNGQAPASPPAPGQTQEDRDLREMLETTVKSLAQEKLVVRVDEHGQIMSVSGGNALGLTGLVPGGTEGLGGAGGTGGAVGGGGGLLGGALEWMIRGSSNQPARARSGATWTNRDALANTPVGALNLSTKYSVTRVSDGQAQITFAGSVEPGPGSSQPVTTGLRVGAAGYTGTCTWDGVKGQISRLDATMDSTIEGEMLGSAIKSKAKSRMTLERLAPSPR